MKPLILKSFLLSKFHGLFHGVSTKIANPNEFNFDLGNFNHLNLEKNLEHRKFFFNLFGIDYKSVVLQRQIHSTIYTFVDSPGIVDGNDAIVTNRRGLYLVVTIADCIPILFYDYKNQIVGAIHAGWRGTADQILIKTMDYAIQSLKIDVKTTYFYFGPSICKDCFEVDEDVAVKFESKYVRKKGKKFLVNLPRINLDYLTQCGFDKEKIQISRLCTYEMKNLFHSYRRDKQNSGRMFAIIGIKDE